MQIMKHLLSHNTESSISNIEEPKCGTKRSTRGPTRGPRDLQVNAWGCHLSLRRSWDQPIATHRRQLV